jgi:hypothetical protein
MWQGKTKVKSIDLEELRTLLIQRDERKVALAMQVMVSIVALGSAVLVIASRNYGGQVEKGAFAVIVVLALYWLNESDGPST